eukprot:TRINITY_DN3825_c0_g4_i1.p1 TRINITY_DN3825_c0_g4~~TRINITY_DN3825_c0_g4_i1.p1  ORF type:complete len:306 (+),score=55.33 TRINITY_DN3825_c0_g4_i1:96-1013(+)
MEAHHKPDPISPHTLWKRNEGQNFSTETVKHVKAPSNAAFFQSYRPARNSCLLDSCELITKSRGTILGLADSKLSVQQPISPEARKQKMSEMQLYSQRKLSVNTGLGYGVTKLKRMSEHVVSQKGRYLAKALGCAESHKQLNKPLGRNSETTHYTDNDAERITAAEGCNDAAGRAKRHNLLKTKQLRETVNPLHALKREVVERKQRISQYKLEILRTLEDDKDDSLVERPDAFQSMSARACKTSAAALNKPLVRFPLAITVKRNHNEVKEKRNSVASKPYRMKRINTKMEKDMKQTIKESNKCYK